MARARTFWKVSWLSSKRVSDGLEAPLGYVTHVGRCINMTGPDALIIDGLLSLVTRIFLSVCMSVYYMRVCVYVGGECLSRC